MFEILCLIADRHFWCPEITTTFSTPSCRGRSRHSSWAPIAVCIGLNMLDGFDISRDVVLSLGGQSRVGPAEFPAGGIVERRSCRHGSGLAVPGPRAPTAGAGAGSSFCQATIAGNRDVGLHGPARGFADLLALRALTGNWGSVGTIASVAVVVSEYAPDRWRSTALAAYATGYPVGGDRSAAALTAPRHFRATAGARPFAIGGCDVAGCSCWSRGRRLPESVISW